VVTWCGAPAITPLLNTGSPEGVAKPGPTEAARGSEGGNEALQKPRAPAQHCTPHQEPPKRLDVALGLRACVLAIWGYAVFISLKCVVIIPIIMTQ